MGGYFLLSENSRYRFERQQIEIGPFERHESGFEPLYRVC